MTVDKIKVAPGAELSIIPTTKFKTNYLALNFYIPLEKVRASRVSLLARVWNRGTEKYPTIADLNKYTDMLYELTFGTSVSSAGGLQILCFRMDYLDDRFIPSGEELNITDSALEFMKECLTRPLVKDGAFCSEYVETEKKLLCDRIRSEINNKDAYAVRRARKNFLGDHPAAISPMGDVDEVSRLDGAELYKELQTIMREAHAEALFVGDVRDGAVDKIVSALKEILPADRLNAPIPKIGRPDYAHLGEDVREITEEVDARQGRMVLGYSIPYEGTESPIATTFLEIFSGSPVSRLFMNVREKLNLCYYCAAGLDVSVGCMLIRSGIAEENVERAMAEIDRQLSDMVAGNISENELALAKTSILSSMKGLKDSGSALGEWYLRRVALGLPSDIDYMMERGAAVTVEEIAELASRAKLKMKYFLRGTQDVKQDTDEEI